MNPLFTISSFNLKIIFGGRFLWFLLTSFLLFAYFVCSSLWRGELPTDEMMYSHLFLPLPVARVLSRHVRHTERC